MAAAALAGPVLLLGMLPALQYPGWAWLAAVLATPVVLWAGSGFHRHRHPRDRLRAEVVGRDGVQLLPAIVGAWAHTWRTSADPSGLLRA